MIKGIHHAGFVVTDLEAMITFYRDVVGLRLLWERKGLSSFTSKLLNQDDAQTHVAMLETDSGERLELIWFERPERPEQHTDGIGAGTAHIAFQVDNLWSVYEKLLESGVRFRNPPAEITNELGSIKAVYAQDPEGNWLEFLQWDAPS